MVLRKKSAESWKACRFVIATVTHFKFIFTGTEMHRSAFVYLCTVWCQTHFLSDHLSMTGELWTRRERQMNGDRRGGSEQQKLLICSRAQRWHLQRSKLWNTQSVLNRRGGEVKSVQTPENYPQCSALAQLTKTNGPRVFAWHIKIEATALREPGSRIAPAAGESQAETWSH